MLERQAWRDAVVRSNAAGLTGLYDRPEPGRSQRLSAGEQAALAGHIFRGPDPEKDGVSAWTRVDLCCWLAARLGKRFHPSSLSRVLRRLAAEGPADQPEPQPRLIPQADPRAQARFQKRGCVPP